MTNKTTEPALNSRIDECGNIHMNQEAIGPILDSFFDAHDDWEWKEIIRRMIAILIKSDNFWGDHIDALHDTDSLLTLCQMVDVMKSVREVGYQPSEVH